MHLSSYQDHISITIEVTTNCFLVSFPPHLAAAPLRPEAVTKPLTTWYLSKDTCVHLLPSSCASLRQGRPNHFSQEGGSFKYFQEKEL